MEVAYEKVYKREIYLKKIRGFYNETEIIKVITGVRRSGKSSLLEMVIDELKDRNISEDNIIVLNLDKRPFKNIKTTESLEKAIDECAKGVQGLKYLFIDEKRKVRL